MYDCAVEPNAPYQFGRILLVVGIVIAGSGLLLMAGSKWSFFGLGRLPGDIAYKGKDVSVYFPVVTSLVLSVVLTLVLWLISWIARK